MKLFRKIKSLRLTNGELYIVCKKGEFIHKYGCHDWVGIDECSIRYIGFGRYLVGYFEHKTTSKAGQNLINTWKIYFPSMIKEIEFK